MPIKITRERAKELGMIRYFTGEPCLRGHYAYRYVRGSKCETCSWEDARVRREKEKAERDQARRQKKYDNCPGHEPVFEGCVEGTTDQVWRCRWCHMRKVIPAALL